MTVAVRQCLTGQEVIANHKRVSEYFRDVSSPADIRRINALTASLQATKEELRSIKFERDQYRAQRDELIRERNDLKEALASMKPLKPIRGKPVAIDDAMNAVCEFYGIDRTELLAPARKCEIVTIRQIAMYLALNYCSPRRSLCQIAKKFERDHTTVLYGEKKIAASIKTDADLASIVKYLESKVLG